MFKFLARTYANAHETMSYESAQCGSSRTHSEKGMINGAQWSSFAGSELQTSLLKFLTVDVLYEMSDGATRGRCKTRGSGGG